MKKLLLIIISIILFSPLMAQETNNDENQARKKSGFIYGMNFLTSTMNDNKELNFLTGINNINQVNMGVDFIVGYSSKIGMEYTFDFGFESWMTKQNNKQLSSMSGLYSFNVGYRIEFCKKAKLAIVPRVGIGWNFNSLNYAEVADRNIDYSELSKYSWNVDQFTNFYVPLSLELRYKTNRTSSIVLGAEYRYFFNYGDIQVMQTNQRVVGFPQFSANELSFKLGYVKII